MICGVDGMEEKRTIGYICPDCGQPVQRERTLFALTAGPAALVCDCGKNQFISEPLPDRFRLTVPCGLCGGEHRVDVDQESFLKGSGVGLSCPETGQLCCYIGEERRVGAAMRELSIAVEKEKAQQDNPEAFLDSVIMYEVLSELKEMAERDGISCACGSKEYQMSVRHAAVDLICGQCGAKLRVPAATDEDLDRLCCRYTLEISGKKL